MIENDLLVTLTRTELKQLIKDALQEFKQQEQPQGERLLSPEEARKIWQPAISKATLHRWQKEGLVPVHKVSGRIYYKLSELLDVVKQVKRYDRISV